jgi:hypothetical protein
LLLEHYPRDKILFLLYDDLVADERAYLRSIHEFIGVDPSVESRQIGQRRHSGRVAEVRFRLERVGLRPVFRMLKRSAAGDILRKASRRALAPPGYRGVMQEPTRRRLVDYYGPMNERLEALLGRDLSAWNG